MPFTPPYHGYGILSKAIKFVYLWANEPQVEAKYSPNHIAQLISGGLDQALHDLYSVAQNPPRAAFNVTLVANQSRYMLPANIQQIHRVANISTTTGRVMWEIIPRSFRDLSGPNILFEGFTSFRLVPIPLNGGDIITIEYVPGGHISMHQNALIANIAGTARITSDTSANTSSAYLKQVETPWLLGQFDRRANAYIGYYLRLLGTHNDVGLGVGGATLSFYPVHERIITNYTMYGDGTDKLLVTMSPSLDSDVNYATLSDPVSYPPALPTAATYLVYETLPNVDPAVMLSAIVNTASDLVAIEGNERKIRLLGLAVEKIKRAANLRWANAQTMNPPHYQEDPYQLIEDLLPI